ncbi:hypothetical protein EVAR_67498_1 [Eumeta japonica]|uniref:Uncharacterized protein n=1 Tax=Eumeta variegata TaxID=151549 RepID=A0A4C1ZF97_EUMVA|nr:hypothetical protein EVAR_67498_1 [Eumeta japonica]
MRVSRTGVSNHRPFRRGQAAHLYRRQPYRKQSRCSPDRMARRKGDVVPDASTRSFLHGLSGGDGRAAKSDTEGEEWRAALTKKTAADYDRFPLSHAKKAIKAIEQTLRGHGGFAHYQLRFKLKDSPYCACDPAPHNIFCSLELDILHALEECYMLFMRGHADLEIEINSRVKRQNFPEIFENSFSSDRVFVLVLENYLLELGARRTEYSVELSVYKLPLTSVSAQGRGLHGLSTNPGLQLKHQVMGESKLLRNIRHEQDHEKGTNQHRAPIYQVQSPKTKELGIRGELLLPGPARGVVRSAGALTVRNPFRNRCQGVGQLRRMCPNTGFRDSEYNPTEVEDRRSQYAIKAYTKRMSCIRQGSKLHFRCNLTSKVIDTYKTCSRIVVKARAQRRQGAAGDRAPTRGWTACVSHIKALKTIMIIIVLNINLTQNSIQY